MTFPYSLYKQLNDDIYEWRKESRINTIEVLAETLGVRTTVAYNWFEEVEDAKGNLKPKTPVPLAKVGDICKIIGRYGALHILCAPVSMWIT